MKIDGLSHPKTKELAFTLGIPLPHAIGLLELMWAFVGQQTPRGNIGKWSDQVIAGEAGWQGDAGEFISALLSVGFLDSHADHRLVVHDWVEHCPNWVHAKLKKKGQRAISSDLSSDLREGQDPTSEGATSLDKPSQGKELSANAECQSPTGDRPAPVPHKQIADLYHQLCPSLPSIAKLTPARQQHIRARWRNELPDLESWADYFRAVQASDFLTGRTNPSGGRSKPWVADIDFLIKQSTVVKMAEGKYD